MSQFSPTVLVALKLLVAVLCGGAIGFERELARKAAGLRTNVLICVGATLFMIISRHISGGQPYTDPARLVAQVVTGIGFLGAGVILQSRGSVTGLTTAATIFVVGAVGISIGEGMFVVALLSTALIIAVLVVFRYMEDTLIRRRHLFRYSLKTADPAGFLEKVLDVLKEQRLHMEDFEVRDAPGGQHEVHLSIITSLDQNRYLLNHLPKLGSDLRSLCE